MVAFSENLAVGQLGESKIARYLMSRGNSVIPVYEKEIDTGKGPRFFTPKGQFVAPDMFVLGPMIWIEAKHKSVFTWYRIGRRWTTGIDQNHYEQYLQVEAVSGRPVWLLFLHRDSTPSQRDLDAGCPKQCPVGLFGARLSRLQRHHSHQSPNWGRHGMIYWGLEDLQLIASLSDLDQAVAA